MTVAMGCGAPFSAFPSSLPYSFALTFFTSLSSEFLSRSIPTRLLPGHHRRFIPFTSPGVRHGHLLQRSLVPCAFAGLPLQGEPEKAVGPRLQGLRCLQPKPFGGGAPRCAPALVSGISLKQRWWSGNGLLGMGTEKGLEGREEKKQWQWSWRRQRQRWQPTYGGRGDETMTTAP